MWLSTTYANPVENYLWQDHGGYVRFILCRMRTGYRLTTLGISRGSHAQAVRIQMKHGMTSSMFCLIWHSHLRRQTGSRIPQGGLGEYVNNSLSLNLPLERSSAAWRLSLLTTTEYIICIELTLHGIFNRLVGLMVGKP